MTFKRKEIKNSPWLDVPAFFKGKAITHLQGELIYLASHDPCTEYTSHSVARLSGPGFVTCSTTKTQATIPTQHPKKQRDPLAPNRNAKAKFAAKRITKSYVLDT